MPWVLLFLLPPLLVFAVLARRVIRLGRQLRDPEQLRSLFSDGVRAALLEAGLDPDSVSIEEIQASEELARLVAADLQRVLRSSVLGLRLPQSRVSPQAAHRRMDDESALSMHRWSTRASKQAEQPFLPPPIDQPSSPGIRTVVVLVIVGLLAVAIFVGSSRP